MISIRSLFSLFLVFVLLFGLCSGSSYASEVVDEIVLPVEYVDELPDARLPGIYVLNENSTSSWGGGTYALTPDDDSMLFDESIYIMQYSYDNFKYGVSNYPMTRRASVGTNYVGGYNLSKSKTGLSFWYTVGDGIAVSCNLRDYIVFHANGMALFKKNSEIDLTVSGFVNVLYDGAVNTKRTFDPSKITNYFIEGQDVDGNIVQLEYEDFEINKINDNTFSVSVHLLPVDFDIYRISIVYDFPSTAYQGLPMTKSTDKAMYRYIGFEPMEIRVDVEAYDEKVGLLQGIIEWLRSIRDGIVNVGTSIIELPSKLWEKISDGLRSLFIPSEDSMIQIRDSWDSLMADRFGAIYEAGSLVDDFTDNFTEQSAKDTIEMPSVTVDLAGTDFTFGGYDIDLVPDRFEFLVDILKGVLDIICTLAFINAMKNRFSKVLGGDNA